MATPGTDGSCRSAGRVTCRCGSRARAPQRRIYVEAPEAKFKGEFPELATRSVGSARSRHRCIAPANGPDERPQLALRPLRGRVRRGVTQARHVGGGEAQPRSSRSAASPPFRSSTAVSSLCTSVASRRRSACRRTRSRAAPTPRSPAYLARHGLLERTGREYVATQATEMGRDGRVHVRVLDDTGRAEIGGTGGDGRGGARSRCE